MVLLYKGLVIIIDCVTRNVTQTWSRFVMLCTDLVINISDCVIRNVKWDWSGLIRKLLYGMHVFLFSNSLGKTLQVLISLELHV